MKVKNISNKKLAVVGIRMFEPQEVREVTEQEAILLLANHNFVEIKEIEVKEKNIENKEKENKNFIRKIKNID